MVEFEVDFIVVINVMCGKKALLVGSKIIVKKCGAASVTH
jgi:hypothetical protein